MTKLYSETKRPTEEKGPTSSQFSSIRFVFFSHFTSFFLFPKSKADSKFKMRKEKVCLYFRRPGENGRPNKRKESFRLKLVERGDFFPLHLTYNPFLAFSLQMPISPEFSDVYIVDTGQTSVNNEDKIVGKWNKIKGVVFLQKYRHCRLN